MRGNFGSPPLGIAYLAAAVKEKGHEVHCIDAYGEKILQFQNVEGHDLYICGLNKNEIASRVPPDTDIIGISCMFSNEWIYTREVVRHLKMQFPKALLILGGEHATADPKQCFLDNPEIDIIVRGEGEETLCEILETLETCDWSRVDGIVWKGKDGQLNVNPPRRRIKDVNSLPWPDWSKIPIQNYLEQKISFGRQGKKSMPLLASRGCPYSCTFCSNPTMWGTLWKVRTAEDVVKEISFYKDFYKIEHFDFMDLTAIVQEDWIIEFCKLLIEKNLELTWALPSGTRSEALTESALVHMKKSGCVKINYAPESGSEESLKRIKKRIDLRKMMSSMKHAVNTGMICRAHIIVGLPGDGWQDLWINYKFALKLALIGMHDIACFGFSPYPGSELHERLVKSGKLKKNENFVQQISQSITTSPSSSLSWNDTFSTNQVRLHIWSMTALFYSLQFGLRPARFFSFCYRILRGQALTTLETLISSTITEKKNVMKSLLTESEKLNFDNSVYAGKFPPVR
jgi:anaerobic magnesium-protoporphyrin IX monomethyl ester cyclase